MCYQGLVEIRKLLMLQFYQICKHEKIEKLTSAHHGSLVKEVLKVINQEQYSAMIPLNCLEIDFKKFEGSEVPVNWNLTEINKIAVLVNDNSTHRTTVIVQKFKTISDAFNDMYLIFRGNFQDEKIDQKKKEKKKDHEKNIDEEEESDVDNDDISGVTEYSAGILIFFCPCIIIY
jgi:hypothetical protein